LTFITGHSTHNGCIKQGLTGEQRMYRYIYVDYIKTTVYF